MSFALLHKHHFKKFLKKTGLTFNYKESLKLGGEALYYCYNNDGDGLFENNGTRQFVGKSEEAYISELTTSVAIQDSLIKHIEMRELDLVNSIAVHWISGIKEVRDCLYINQYHQKIESMILYILKKKLIDSNTQKPT